MSYYGKHVDHSQDAHARRAAREQTKVTIDRANKYTPRHSEAHRAEATA